LQRLLQEHGGNVSLVAKAMGSNRSQVYRWLRTYGLSPNEYRV
jgi:transposase-like protein